MLNDFFQKIYCISLLRRPDRRANAHAQFKLHNLNVEVVNGVDGGALSPVGRITSGRLGCLLSHLKVLQKAQLAGWDSFLVLEDDVQFASDLEQRFAHWCDEVPPDWEMLYLGWLQTLPILYDPIT